MPCPPPGDLRDPGTKPTSLALAGRFFTTEPPGKPIYVSTCLLPASHLQLSLSHLLTICQSRYVSSTCLFSSYHLCVNKSIYLSLVISAHLSFTRQHICYLFISPSINFLSIIYLPWRRKWQPTPVLLPGKSHGRRSLISYSPWGHKESATTERLHFYFSLYLSTHLAIICYQFISIDLSIYLLSVYPPFHPSSLYLSSVFLSSVPSLILLSVCPSVLDLFISYLSSYLPINHLFIHPLIYLHAYIFTYESIKLFVIYLSTHLSTGLSRGLSGTESCGQCRRHRRHKFDPWVGKMPWRKARQPSPASLPGESHGQSSLAGCSPWGHRNAGHG